MSVFASVRTGSDLDMVIASLPCFSRRDKNENNGNVSCCHDGRQPSDGTPDSLLTAGATLSLPVRGHRQSGDADVDPYRPDGPEW